MKKMLVKIALVATLALGVFVVGDYQNVSANDNLPVTTNGDPGGGRPGDK